MANDCIQILVMREYQGLRLIKVSNWDGIGYLGSRRHIALLSKVAQLKNPGVYFLLGEEEGEKKLYVGESENVAARLQTHTASDKKDWFEDFIVFTSERGDLNKAHIKHLEAKFIEAAQKISTTIKLMNGCNSNTVKDTKLREFDAARAEGFEERVKLVLRNLNLIGLIDEQNLKPNEREIFYVNLMGKNKSRQARLVKFGDGYLLLSGSFLEKETENKKSFRPYIEEKRKEQQAVIEEKDNVYVTTKDIYFKSPSGAGRFVLGRSCDGRTDWRLIDGTSIGEYELLERGD